MAAVRRRTYAAEYARRQEIAREKGWASLAQRRWWEKRLATPDVVAALAARCCAGRGHEKARAGSLFCGHCNDAVNPRTAPRGSVWQIRLVRHVLTQERRDRQGRFVKASVRKARRTRLERAGVPVGKLEERV